MPHASRHHLNGCSTASERLSGHALRNAHLCDRALARAATAPPLARAVVQIRAGTLRLTRLEFARRAGISRGALRDLELGIHTPTRRILQQFVAYCQRRAVAAEQLEELRRLYAGPGATLEELIARLELRAGSSRELARRVGISPATLWEYRRGNFPLPLPMLRKLCQAGGEDALAAEPLWHEAQRQRFLQRGYPEALAEFWALCARAGYAEKHLLTVGLTTATVRQLRYLEFPPWAEVADLVKSLCRDEAAFSRLHRLWVRDQLAQARSLQDRFGPRLKQLREEQGVSRRELADLFSIGGRKPARIIKYVEEDGFYSAQAYPAGLVSLLADGTEQSQLLEAWRERRRQFHRRHRPETRIELRLAREMYGFEVKHMEPILGYTSLEYQRIERGVCPLLDTGGERILQAIHQAGRQRIEALFAERHARAEASVVWQAAPSVADLFALLARREGGLIPLSRQLREAGVKGLWTGRLRAIVQQREVPPWALVVAVAEACGAHDLAEVRQDWEVCYRAHLRRRYQSPLGVELRVLIAEVATTLRAFSPRLPFNYSVLIRDIQRLDRDDPVKWSHVERILRAANLAPDVARWREIRALWSTAAERK